MADNTYMTRAVGPEGVVPLKEPETFSGKGAGRNVGILVSYCR